MATTQEFQTIVSLNSQEAKNNLNELQKKVNDLQKARDNALRAGKDATFVKQLSSDLTKARAEIKAYGANVNKTIYTLNNLSKSSVEDIKKAMRALKKEMDKTTDPKDYKQLNDLLEMCKDRMDDFTEATGGTHKELKGMAEEAEATARALKNLDTASLGDLRMAQSSIEKQMASMSPNTAQWKSANEQLLAVKSRIQEIGEKQRVVNSVVDQYNREMREAGLAANQVRNTQELINRTMNNLPRASVKDLRTSLKLVNEELENLDRGTEEFEKMEKQAKKLRQELNKVEKEGKAQGSWIGRLADGVNRAQGLIVGAMASLTGLTMTIRSTTKAYAEMDQEMTNVMKYTGQTKEEVEEMNEVFKNMDTRTSREKLNQLAGDAGRLGITTREMILEFVDGADKINVALGDDLGDKAVAQIGKMAQVFGEDKEKGLRGAMLATGSAVNELAQNSSAAAGYLVDFTARVSGVGKQAGLTQTQIMGFASVLDQNMQQDETAATAMSNLLTKMFQEPAKFAKLAGVEVKTFSEMLKNDANQAVLTFLDTLKAQGGFAQLAPMFESMSMDGSRATGVISTLADKVDDIRVAQELANEAYNEGSSVIREFDVQMTSEQALMDMATKQFKELSISLGKDLLPVARLGLSTGSLLVKALSAIINFVKENITLLGVLTAAIVTLTISYKAATIAMKAKYTWGVMLNALHKAETILINAKIIAVNSLRAAYFLLTGQMGKLKIAIDAVRVASMKNPITAILAVIMSLGVAIWGIVKANQAWSKSSSDNAKKLKEQKQEAELLDRVNKSMNDSTMEEITRINRLNSIIHDNTRSLAERRNAIEAIKKVVPDYHASITNEGKLINDNSKAIQDYIQNLKDMALAEAYYQELVDANKKLVQAQRKQNQKQTNVNAVQAEINRHPEYYNATNDFVDVATGTYSHPTEANKKKHRELQLQQEALKSATDAVKLAEANVRTIEKQLSANRKVGDYVDRLANGEQLRDTPTPTSVGSGGGSTGTGTGTGGGVDKEKEKLDAERKKQMKEELEAAKKQNQQLQAENILAYQSGTKAYRQFIQDRNAIDVQGIDAQIAVYQKYNQDYAKLSENRAEKEMEAEEQKNAFLLADSERQYQREVALANAAYHNKDSDIYMDEAALNERLFEAEMAHLQRKLDLQKQFSEEWLNVKAEMDNKELDHQYDLAEYYAKKEQEIRKKYGKQSAEDNAAQDLAILKDLLEKKKITEQEYYAWKKEAERNAALAASEQAIYNSTSATTQRNAQTAYQTASNNATAMEMDQPQTLGSFLIGDITHYRNTVENLKKMYGEDYENYEEYQQAKSIAFDGMRTGMMEKMQVAVDSMGSLLSGLSSYYDAQSSYEQAVTEKKYDKMIEAAGKNSTKAKKLEEKKEKEIAKIKSKYNKKQMKIEIAQAVAQTAMAAINSYASASKVSWVLGPIAAAIAVAAGALQIASIKKAHQAEEAGYYSGGYTGGHRYHDEAGVVHEGEFVANHQAVNNTRLRPALDLIDQAQRNNTVGSLTESDVSRSLGMQPAVVSAPSVTVNTTNEELNNSMTALNQVVEQLNTTLSNGITAYSPIDGPDGLYRNLQRYEQLRANR